MEGESLAVGIAEIGARFVASRLGLFSFLAFVLGELFVGIGKGVARGEHGIGTARLLLFLSQGAELMADLAQRRFDCFYFDEEIADLFQEIVKVIGPDHIGETRDFELDDVLAAARFGNQKKGADAATLLRGNGGEFAQGDESWPVDTRQGYVGDDKGPFAGFELRKEHLGVWDNADAPTFGVQDLFYRTGALGVVVQNEQAYLTGLNSGTSTHNTRL